MRATGEKSDEGVNEVGDECENGIAVIVASSSFIVSDTDGESNVNGIRRSRHSSLSSYSSFHMNCSHDLDVSGSLTEYGVPCLEMSLVDWFLISVVRQK